MTNNYNKILHNFKYLPKPNINPTFMDLCHLKGDRFEERCSQILQFYFSPLAPHKLRGLFLNSLLELLNLDSTYTIQNIKVITEETTEDGKRIDITIIGDDFVIAIENKIFANIYNPLESYQKHIAKKYQNKATKRLVLLSVKKITSAERCKISTNGFKYINYADLFSIIKKNIGQYIQNCDQSYLIFMFDFIRTIENKYIENNMELKKFFFDNKEAINEMIEQYNAFKQEIFSTQCEYISQIKTLVDEKTNTNWQIWEKWDLYIRFNDNSNSIGIECSFRDESLNNPIGDFHICITVWEGKCFTPYETELIKNFGNNIYYKSIENRVYLHLPFFSGPMDEDKLQEIANKLAEYYFILKDITDKIQ